MGRTHMQVKALDRPARPATSDLSLRDWKALCRSFKQRCAYCGVRPDVLVVEHNMPEYRGGADTIENILPACKSCNSSKRDLTPLEWILCNVEVLRRAGPTYKSLRVVEPNPEPTERLAVLHAYHRPVLIYVLRETPTRYWYVPLMDERISCIRYLYADRKTYTAKENVRILGAA